MNTKEFITNNWGKQGEIVIVTCQNTNAQSMTMDEFLSHCTVCGGNWVAMILTGIKTLYPAVYNAIPDDMGHLAWACLCKVLELLNIMD